MGRRSCGSRSVGLAASTQERAARGLCADSLVLRVPHTGLAGSTEKQSAVATGDTPSAPKFRNPQPNSPAIFSRTISGWISPDSPMIRGRRGG